MTTNPDIERALAVADPRLGRLIEVVRSQIGTVRPPRSKASPFVSLLRAVVYQRMATKAAATVFERLKQKVSSLTPEQVLAVPNSELRHIGLSGSKVQYVKAVAQWFDSNRPLAKRLVDIPDGEVVQTLTEIPGIGIWTVNVLLIFGFQRLDVMPTNDLGIRRAVQMVYRLRDLPDKQSVQRRALRWKPYRSIASMYLWQSGHLKVTAQQLR